MAGLNSNYVDGIRATQKRSMSGQFKMKLIIHFHNTTVSLLANIYIVRGPVGSVI